MVGTETGYGSYTTITDPGDKQKGYLSNAQGQLLGVEELKGGTLKTTAQYTFESPIQKA